jgi:outer membrane protein assembly factor BamB
VVYIGSGDKKLYAFPSSCSTPCSPLWSSAATGNLIYSSPAVANGVVYVGSSDTKLYAFPASCSTPCASLWAATTGSNISSPIVADGSVFLGGDDGFLHVYDLPSAGTSRAHRRPNARSLHRNRRLRLHHRTRGRVRQVKRASPVPGGV